MCVDVVVLDWVPTLVWQLKPFPDPVLTGTTLTGTLCVDGVVLSRIPKLVCLVKPLPVPVATAVTTLLAIVQVVVMVVCEVPTRVCLVKPLPDPVATAATLVGMVHCDEKTVVLGWIHTLVYLAIPLPVPIRFLKYHSKSFPRSVPNNQWNK